MTKPKSTILILLLICLQILLLSFILLQRRYWPDHQPALIPVNIGLPDSSRKEINISESTGPAHIVTLGQVGKFYLIETNKNELFPFALEVSYDSSQSAQLDESSLTLFYCEKNGQTMRPLVDSRVDSDRNTVSGSITASGIITVIGLPSDQSSRNLLVALNRYLGNGVLPPDLDLRVERTCELIRCESLSWIRNDAIRSSQYLSGLGRDQLGFAGAPDRPENICDQCAGLTDLTRDIVGEVVGTVRALDGLFPERGLLDISPDDCQAWYY